MYPPVQTNNPEAVEVEVQAAYLAMFPDGDKSFVARAFGWAKDCFNGKCLDYQAVDLPYHDLEHTMQGTLCLARLLHRRHQVGAKPGLNPRTFELALIAILFHDTGYLKKRDDTAGTGAKYTLIHVKRSTDFAATFLGQKDFEPDEIKAVQNMVFCTGLDAVLNAIQFGSELERIGGHALGTADLLGQIAATDYVEKLPALYREFAEAARHCEGRKHVVASYSSAEDLMRQSPEFWEKVVLVKLNQDFGALYKFLNDPYPGGSNWYLDRIEANMKRLRR